MAKAKAEKDEPQQPNGKFVWWILSLFLLGLALLFSWGMLQQDGLKAVVWGWSIVGVGCLCWYLTDERLRKYFRRFFTELRRQFHR